jgi:tripartite-type tricarboxylate transporter receptor subunit TctC
MPNCFVEGWFAVIGPAKLPPVDVKRVNTTFAAAFVAPEVREAMAEKGSLITVSAPEFAAQYFRSESARYAAIVKKIGLESQ